MRLALIQTPVEDFYSTSQRTYPLGLSYLAGAINDINVDITILDFLTNHGRQSISIPKAFKPIMDLLPYDHSPISAFHTYYHWGKSWKSIKQYFSVEKYDIYAISSNFYTYSYEVLKTAEIIKSCNPESIVLVGGQNIGPEHNLFISSEYVDYCVQGEGEYAFREAIIRIMNNKDISDIPGFWNKNLSKWNDIKRDCYFSHLSAFKLLPIDKYKIAGKNSMMIATSRGCPMGCKFCSVSRTFGDRLRLKSVSMIINEMRAAYDRGIRAFDIEDDNFTFVKEHCIELLRHIVREFNGNISLYAMNGLSAEHLNEEILHLLKLSGMKLLNLSIATTSKKQLQNIHRKTSIKHFKDITKIASSKNFRVMGHFIAGMPGQNPDEILETMKVLSELPTILGISPFYYIPGMKMDVPNIPKNCKEARLSRFWPADNYLNENDLITLFRLSRWINYLKKTMKEQGIKSIAFFELQHTFMNDPYIVGLANNRQLIGLDNKNNHFILPSSKKIIDQFIDKFQEIVFSV